MNGARPRHFLSTLGWSRDELERVLASAAELKQRRHQPERLRGTSIALVFFNPSLRTRSTFEIGIFEMGGHAVVLEPGKGAWPIEFKDGAIMDGDAEEHVEEVSRVLSRYCGVIAVRAFPKFERWEDDREDRVIEAFARHATVPVINMETITHPMQELALMLALKERLGTTDKKKFVLTWTYHPKPLNTAVANSGLIIAAKFGFDVTLLCPTPEYALDARYMEAARESTRANGRALPITHDVDAAYDGDERRVREELGRPALLRSMARREADPRRAPALHRRRGEDGEDGEWRPRPLQPLPAAPAQREGDRRGGARADVDGDRRGGEPPARAEGAPLSLARGRRIEMSTVVLAFSGGLDTSFCVPYLRERGHEVVTLFVDTGGVSAEQRAEIEARALRLGAKRHVTADGADDVWSEVVVPLVYGGQLYQDQYPLLVSDRYVIVKRAVALADELGTKLVAHGCTGMGNDQVRFDLSVRALGAYHHPRAHPRHPGRAPPNVRDYERGYLKRIGYEVPAKQTVYTINENLLGVTMSGSEIDEWKEPGPGTYQLTAKPGDRPTAPTRVAITFEEGVAIAIDGARQSGPAIVRELNARLGAHGVGRGIYTGDTTVGLKGRIVFEAPGLVALVAAHRALEEAVLTAQENAFKPVVAKKWVELVLQGLLLPSRSSSSSRRSSARRSASSRARSRSRRAAARPLARRLDSAHVLRAKNAVYAQRADWSAKEAEGFIRLLGQSAALSADVNPRGAAAKKPAS